MAWCTSPVAAKVAAAQAAVRARAASRSRSTPGGGGGAADAHRQYHGQWRLPEGEKGVRCFRRRFL